MPRLRSGHAPMTTRQLATLRTLSAEAYQPKLFEKDLTATKPSGGSWR